MGKPQKLHHQKHADHTYTTCGIWCGAADSEDRPLNYSGWAHEDKRMTNDTTAEIELVTCQVCIKVYNRRQDRR